MPKKPSWLFWKGLFARKKNTWLEAGFRAFPVTKIFQRSLKNPLLWKLPDYAHVPSHLAKKFWICIPSFEGTLLPRMTLPIMKARRKVFEQAYIRFPRSCKKHERKARDRDTIGARAGQEPKRWRLHSSSDPRFNFSRLFQTDCRSWVCTWSCDFGIWKEDDHIEAWMGADTAGSSLSPICSTKKEETTHYESINHF